jgi:aminopeptidase N
VQEDLWDELTLQAHADNTLEESLFLKDIMHSWTLRKGYPVLQMDREGDRLILTQKWFLLNPLNKVQNENITEYNEYRW